MFPYNSFLNKKRHSDLLLNGHKIRKACVDKNEGIPKHNKEITQQPTAKLCFSYFTAFSVMTIQEPETIEIYSIAHIVAEKILYLLGPPYEKMYQIP